MIVCRKYQHEEDDVALCSVSADTPGDTRHVTETANFTLCSQQSFKFGSCFPCGPAPVPNYSTATFSCSVQYYYSALSQGKILLYIFECVLCSSELYQLHFTKTEKLVSSYRSLPVVTTGDFCCFPCSFQCKSQDWALVKCEQEVSFCH